MIVGNVHQPVYGSHFVVQLCVQPCVLIPSFIPVAQLVYQERERERGTALIIVQPRTFLWRFMHRLDLLMLACTCCRTRLHTASLIFITSVAALAVVSRCDGPARDSLLDTGS